MSTTVSSGALSWSTRSAPPSGTTWLPLEDNGVGYLSFYFSEPLARYAVRELTRPGDNKSDPNIETGTYGLFSTCEPGMRGRIVADGAGTVFFLTSHRDRPRAVTGYYEIGWYTTGERGLDSKDWALAARTRRFVQPMPLQSLASAIPEAGGTSFRTQRRLSVDSVGTLRALIDAVPDLTDEYVDELHRIERFAASKSGFAYPSWGRLDGFTEADTATFLSAGLGGAPNSSQSQRWLCSACKKIIANRALLRRCPACDAVGTLTPLAVESA